MANRRKDLQRTNKYRQRLSEKAAKHPRTVVLTPEEGPQSMNLASRSHNIGTLLGAARKSEAY